MESVVIFSFPFSGTCFFLSHKNTNVLFMLSHVICRFLFDESCSDYKYYEYRIAEEEKVVSHARDEYQTSRTGWHLNFSILLVNRV